MGTCMKARYTKVVTPQPTILSGIGRDLKVTETTGEGLCQGLITATKASRISGRRSVVIRDEMVITEEGRMEDHTQIGRPVLITFKRALKIFKAAVRGHIGFDEMCRMDITSQGQGEVAAERGGIIKTENRTGSLTMKVLYALKGRSSDERTKTLKDLGKTML